MNFRRCYILLMFDSLLEGLSPNRKEFFFDGDENRHFCTLLTLKIKILLNYHVFRPRLHWRKAQIVLFIIYPKIQGVVSTSIGS